MNYVAKARKTFPIFLPLIASKAVHESCFVIEKKQNIGGKRKDRCLEQLQNCEYKKKPTYIFCTLCIFFPPPTNVPSACPCPQCRVRWTYKWNAKRDLSLMLGQAHRIPIDKATENQRSCQRGVMRSGRYWRLFFSQTTRGLFDFIHCSSMYFNRSRLLLTCKSTVKNPERFNTK